MKEIVTVHPHYGQIGQKIVTLNTNTKVIVTLYIIYGKIRPKHLWAKTFWGKFFLEKKFIWGQKKISFGEKMEGN